MTYRRQMKPALAAVLTAAVLAACSGPADVDEKTETDDADHVWSDQTDALDKARALEDTLTDAEKKRRKQLEDDGG